MAMRRTCDWCYGHPVMRIEIVEEQEGENRRDGKDACEAHIDEAVTQSVILAMPDGVMPAQFPDHPVLLRITPVEAES